MPRTRSLHTQQGAVFAALAALCLWGPCAQASDYQLAQQARSVLSEYCFACHGPDEADRKAGLRLDTREGVEASGVLVADETGVVPILDRLASEDRYYVMPPPREHRQPTGEDREVLKKWIEAGASYESLWSFQPVRAVEPPPVADSKGWAPSPIDAFVLARLLEAGIEPSPPAPRETWIRRVTLDLTGLPPSLEEIDSFLADESPEAFEKVVDRLLASPAYGERMANQWLDLARYADTYGYQNDRETNTWPWRDWVISAFNENLPYDQFITWQLAGDLLDNPSQDQMLATAFNRLHRQTNEGGSVLEEFRVEYVSDRTHTFGTAFLGMTFECARCHDHKFDPISQKDYYELTAFFGSIDESGMYSHFTDAIPSPSLFLYRAGEKERHSDLKAAIAEAEAGLAAVTESARGRFENWLADADRTLATSQPVVHLSLDAILESASIEDRANPGQMAKPFLEPEVTGGALGKGMEFSGDNGVDVPHAPKFDRDDPFSFSLWIKTATDAPREVVFHRSMAAEDAASRGYELLLEGGYPVFGLNHFWPGNAIRVKSKTALTPGQWEHVAISYDGSSRAAGVSLYLNGSPVPAEVVRDGLRKTIRYTQGDEGDPALRLASRFRDNGFKEGCIDEFQVFDRELSSMEVATLAFGGTLLDRVTGKIALGQGQDLFDHYLHTQDPNYQSALGSLREARRAESEFVEGLQEIMVMEELPEPRPAYLLKRGAYDQRGEQLGPDTPASILPFPEDLPKNRLGLARWVTSPANPLTSRVAVNRVWQIFFGKGLVRTAEDFGNQGSLPTHPDLLDYLAHEFMTGGWDLKSLCRKIALSSTYRQDSTPRPDLRDIDPENQLLARGPRHRLSAEQIRDSALAAGGLLVEKIGGPSAKPYQPEGLWRDASQVTYTPDTGEGLYRRSLYTFIKRTVPPPTMLTFDATNREVCVARREITSTPLQSLILLNDPQFVEAARVLAARICEESSNPEDCVGTVFRTLTGREPDEHEREILASAYRQHVDYFANHPEEAAAYLEVGESPVPEKADKTQLAALTAVAQIGMNFEEFQVKQ